MDQKLAVVAEKQHGAFTLWQARAVGFTPAAVRHRLSSGRWQELADGVYRLCGAPYTWEQRLIALTFAAGPDAAASYRSAAALLGIPGFDRKGWPEVTTPRARRHRAPGTVVHRWRPFPEQHLTVIEGIVTTRVARTLIDLAGVLNPARTERAVDNCLAAGVLTLEALHATFGDLAGRGRKGVATIRAILDVRTAEYVAPASELEALFVELLRAAGLPEPVRQLNAGGAEGWIGRIDFGYPAAGLLIELDGRRHHTSLLDREADQRRTASLLAAGWRYVLRFTWSDIVNRPEAVIAQLRAFLGDLAA